MRHIKKYTFHKSKYGEELLIDVVELQSIKKYLIEESIHSLSYYDITLITEGEGKFVINDKTYFVKPGSVIFSSPNQIRQWDVKSTINGYALIFEKDFLLSFFNDPEFLNHISYYRDSHNNVLTLTKEIAYVRGVMEEIQDEISLYKDKDKHILRALLYQVLKYLDRAYIQHYAGAAEIKSPKNRYVLSFMVLANTHFRQHHSIVFYSDRLCITPNYLNQLIKAETGMNPKQMIQDKIIQEAKKMLMYTDLSISEIASNLSFESTSYFIRLFRKKVGDTPLHYRTSNKP
ncbi:AraC-like DNA-binding protein [Dysgonomonas hofstadii]|uniref:AraC-like DNA-binding protein n=1 Tax=Dysgonomonas hofstadii TaxID=637886 RepID=A0A840CIK1_9BACT|nr:helix-turn-helix transcriptional regulator [Dysgonomonas hofstadii]MBB4035867.1 AraC-like DNA-binding protein [Dysgonomonas hofstadii]